MSPTTQSYRDNGDLLAHLAAVGHPAGSLADLRHSGARYEKAIPVLLEWLPQVADVKAKGEIVRALSVPWARPIATRPLIDEFRHLDASADPTGTGLRWTIGNALEVLFLDAEFDAFADLSRKERYGKARQMVVLGLGKSRRPEAASVLFALLDDPDVDGHAVKALGKLKVPESRLLLEKKLADDRAWVRKEARKALGKLPS